MQLKDAPKCNKNIQLGVGLFPKYLNDNDFQ